MALSFSSLKAGAGCKASQGRSSGQQAVGVRAAESAFLSEQPGPQPSLGAWPAPPGQRAATEQVGACTVTLTIILKLLRNKYYFLNSMER